ncbi:hypothetical protein HH214_15865 [Mucilaginibacter robiniae]|uniref:DUF2271 domain-containing protein n=1 Tax=Mucilaginibacter robiniae TaxID=2728022 RepID=A0A7L5E4K7_9SPHI|nr:hypothetical protein [Mucilaginibacter robiniae]QJD97239.1 hypothetical protein HH214_15865 [Mucilaginibacter robiniae]
MKKSKLILGLVALVCASITTAFAAKKANVVQSSKLGVPYSLEYIAKHSTKNLVSSLLSNLVTFHESGATQSVYKTYDWSVQFYQNGGLLYTFDTNGAYHSWNNTSYNDEIWIGDTVSPAAGTYTIIIQNTSGVGGTYESGVTFTNANGQDDSVWSGDVITDRRDIVLSDVSVDGVSPINIYVNKTQF